MPEIDKKRGFLTVKRQLPSRRAVADRLRDYNDVYVPLPVVEVQRQTARCMDCGIPFCQSGCPLGNSIPDWNELAFKGQWRTAYERLRSTNNFPEFTGRICPAPCESACVLGLVDQPVTIEHIEQAIIEYAFQADWVKPKPPARRTGKSVAIIGSGPAGLAAADQINQAGHHVTVFERDDRIGGLLRYGIPDFKMEKDVLDRRLRVMEKEGIVFKAGVEVGQNYSIEQLRTEFDAAVVCIGATQPRALEPKELTLEGVHYAFDYLKQQNQVVAGDDLSEAGITQIVATGKDVIVIGGGDTGSDCIGTANRQGARSVTQFDHNPTPPAARTMDQPWPFMPKLYTVTTSHEEGAERTWKVQTKGFVEKNGRVIGVRTVEVIKHVHEDGSRHFEEVSGSETIWPADLVLIAIGYIGPERKGLVEQLDLALDGRGCIQTDANYQTNQAGIFAAGDGRRGQSLVVWAISEGREAARAVDAYLMGETVLPTKGVGDLIQA